MTGFKVGKRPEAALRGTAWRHGFRIWSCSDSGFSGRGVASGDPRLWKVRREARAVGHESERRGAGARVRMKPASAGLWG